uniref:LIM zinc-binding domain-containing protein n=7 Tax=Boreoeutheria TaxID=1437010 RepID=A0A8D2BN90_PIG
RRRQSREQLGFCSVSNTWGRAAPGAREPARGPPAAAAAAAATTAAAAAAAASEPGTAAPAAAPAAAQARALRAPPPSSPPPGRRPGRRRRRRSRGRGVRGRPPAGGAGSPAERPPPPPPAAPSERARGREAGGGGGGAAEARGRAGRGPPGGDIQSEATLPNLQRRLQQLLPRRRGPRAPAAARAQPDAEEHDPDRDGQFCSPPPATDAGPPAQPQSRALKKKKKKKKALRPLLPFPASARTSPSLLLRQPRRPFLGSRAASLAFRRRRLAQSCNIGEKQTMVNPGSSSQPPPVTAGSLSWKRCAGCGGKIADRFLLYAMDSYWHSRCLKCSCCQAQLGDIGTSCYTKSGMILCRNDYIRSAKRSE